MDEKLPVVEIVVESWRLAARAFVPSLPWLGLLMVACGGFFLALGRVGDVGSGVVFGAFLIACFAGMAFSLAVYRKMLGQKSGRLVSLGHANVSVYVAFLFVGVFISFFLLLLFWIIFAISAGPDFDPNADPDITREAMRAMLLSSYGAVFYFASAAGVLALSFMAVRLLLFGAASVQTGETMVFRTWAWTKGHALRLGLAALVTHVAPFAVAAGIFTSAAPRLAAVNGGMFLGGALVVLLLAPFILAGHGLAVSVLPRLMPDPDYASEIASVE